MKESEGKNKEDLERERDWRFKRGVTKEEFTLRGIIDEEMITVCEEF